MKYAVVVVSVFMLVATVAAGAPITLDLGTLTVEDDVDIQNDMKAMVDRYKPTTYQKTPAQYKAALTELCREWLIKLVSERVNKVKVESIANTAVEEEAAAQHRKVLEDSD